MHAALNTRREDRRRYPRFPMNGALQVRANGLEIPISATVRDISAGGCKLDCRVALTSKQALRIELPQPGAPALVVEGNVVRATLTQSDRMNHYGIRFRIETANFRDTLVAYISRYCRFKYATSAGDRRTDGIVDVKFAVTISAPEIRPFNAMAIALGAQGMRIATDRVLRQEWMMKIDLKLPGGMIGAPVLMMVARAKPGAKPVRGSYVQDVEFVEPSLRALAEIERAMGEAKSRRSRAVS